MHWSGATWGGSETGGHYYFQDNFSIASGGLAMLRMLQVCSKAQQPLAVLRQPFEVYANSGEIRFRVSDRDAAIQKLAANLNDDAELDRLNGLTVRRPNC